MSCLVDHRTHDLAVPGVQEGQPCRAQARCSACGWFGRRFVTAPSIHAHHAAAAFAQDEAGRHKCDGRRSLFGWSSDGEFEA